MTSGQEYDNPAIYEIRVRGKLDARWSRWFANLQITPQPDGECLLTGPIHDQAALYGAISRMRDLGLVLISVHRVPRKKEPNHAQPDKRERTKPMDGPEGPNDVELTSLTHHNHPCDVMTTHPLEG